MTNNPQYTEGAKMAYMDVAKLIQEVRRLFPDDAAVVPTTILIELMQNIRNKVENLKQ